jgi:uncharacterized membrane protein YadS
LEELRFQIILLGLFYALTVFLRIGKMGQNTNLRDLLWTFLYQINIGTNFKLDWKDMT